MVNLTFGEQVKIILSRKGMTIKELAEIIEGRTGKKMSRQNLTQRLGRDNFQEQDMRMIADILGCPFQLSIMADSESVERAAVIEEILPTEKELSKIARSKERKESKSADLEAKKEVVEKTAPKAVESERDITIGELVDIHKELDELLLQDEREKSSPKMSVAEIMEEVEAIEKENQKKEAEDKAIEFKRPESEKKTRGWKAYLQKMANRAGMNQEEETAETEQGQAYPQQIDKEEADGYTQASQFEDLEEDDDYVDYESEEGNMVQDSEEDIFEDDEDLEAGDVNPYSGHEFETNSVRIHPKRIGYVQVYDRSDHKWTDMTEWAFLGYQERKKALLGKDYEPPVYLD